MLVLVAEADFEREAVGGNRHRFSQKKE